MRYLFLALLLSGCASTPNSDRWVQERREHLITPEEYDSLVKGQENLKEMGR